VISVAVGALEGKLELYLETQGFGTPEPFTVEPTHQGLMQLWGFFQMLGPVPVYLMPEVNDRSLTGLPEGVNVQHFVSAAQTLGNLGWHSCPGGTA